MTPTLDSRIDDLYKGALDTFVSARNALAKSLSGADAARIKSLAKPGAVPWVINQVYWHDRPVYDRLVSAGKKLRAAQIAVLGGRPANILEAGAAHRAAVAAAATAAARRPSLAGVKPHPDALARMLEAVSLLDDTPEPPGRFTSVLQPAGFEALAGVTIEAAPARARLSAPDRRKAAEHGKDTARVARQREVERAAVERRHEKAFTKAEAALADARERLATVRRALDRATQDVADAERTLSELQAARPGDELPAKRVCAISETLRARSREARDRGSSADADGRRIIQGGHSFTTGNASSHSQRRVMSRGEARTDNHHCGGRQTSP